jgi:hypothetical protein
VLVVLVAIFVVYEYQLILHSGKINKRASISKMDVVEMACKQNSEENIEFVSPCTNSSSEKKCTIISEGLAEVEVIDSKNVFYNPVQEFNRDIR